MLPAKKSRTLLVCIGAIALCYAGMVCVLLHPSLPQTDEPILFYSNQTRQDLKRVFATAIEKARASVCVHTYAISDLDIIKTLQKKEKQKIQTSVFYDASASPLLNTFLTHAAPVKTKGLMHKKIVVIDNAQCFLGSANLTTQSLRMHDNLVVGFYHREAASFLTHPNAPSFSFALPNQQAQLWMLPDTTGQALEKLIQQIKNAKKKIRLAMFTLTHPKLTEALIDAVQRGVVVKCAVDYYTGQGASAKAAQRLYFAGIHLYLSRGQQLLHHKWAEIDSTTLILGSANWTKAAFSRNSDCFLILEPLNKRQKKFMKSLWSTIKEESERWIP